MSARRSRRALLSLGLRSIAVGAATALALTSGLAGAHANAQLDQSRDGRPAVSMRLKASAVIGGRHVVAHGATSTHLRRPVALQRRNHGAWHVVKSAHTNRRGAFSLTDPVSRVGTYRVVAPAVRSAGHRLQKLVSKAETATLTAHLAPGQQLLQGESITSPSHAYALVMQGDGNLVLYGPGGAVWSSGTTTPGSYAVIQHDGNLVVYNPAHAALWHSTTYGFDGASLDVQDDGNLVIYQNGRPLWDYSTGPLYNGLTSNQSLGVDQLLRSVDHRFTLVMQGDGNLVEYQDGVGALWSSNTSVPGSYAVMQGDGNLVVYPPDGSPPWSTTTSDKPGARLVLQSDGNLVIYQGATAVWDRHVGRIGGPGGGGTGSGVIGDDYPANLKAASRDALVDPWLFYNRECTSFVAWRMNSANGIAFANYMGGGHFGNANHWDDNARTLGYAVNGTPAVGAIAQTDAGSAGQVAWVAAVGPGTVTIEEYNRALTGVYSARTVPTSTFQYIHIHDLG
jgi:surface antigen